MAFNVQFPGTLVRSTPGTMVVVPCGGKKVRLFRKGVIAATPCPLPVPYAPYWFTVANWMARQVRITDARPVGER